MTSDLGSEISATSTYMTGLGSNNLGFSSGLFDFGPTASNHNNNVKDAEICRLREELGAARSKLASWEESMSQARTACDAWKREAAMANKKAEVASKEKEMAIAKCTSLQKEVNEIKPLKTFILTSVYFLQIEQMRVEPMRRLHQDMHNLQHLPPQYLKNIEWNLRKEMTEVDKVRSSPVPSGLVGTLKWVGLGWDLAWGGLRL